MIKRFKTILGWHARVARKGVALPARIISFHIVRPYSWLAFTAIFFSVTLILSVVPISVVSPFDIIGDIEASSLTMRLEQPLDIATDILLDPKFPGEVAGFNSAEGWKASLAKAHTLTIPASAGSANLSSLSLTKLCNLTLQLRQFGKQVDLTVLVSGEGGASITFLERPPKAATAAEGDTGIGVPNVFTARYRPGSVIPMRVTARLLGTKIPGEEEPIWADDFAFENLSITNLHFSRPNTQEDGDAFLSSVQSGHVTILSTGVRTELSISSPFVLTDFLGTIVRLSIKKSSIHIYFSGSANWLAMGPAGFPQRLTPSILDILIHKKGVQVGCGLLLAMMTALAPVFLRLREEKPEPLPNPPLQNATEASHEKLH